MKKFYIWGCSDDLIEITGDINEEFDGYRGKLLFSDGSIISINYNDAGEWDIFVDSTSIRICTRRILKGTDEAEKLTNGRDYSDVMEVIGEIEWFAFTPKIVRVK